MARAGVSRIAKLSFRGQNPTVRCLSKVVRADPAGDKSRETIKVERRGNPSCWVPHHRTGIYVPKGQEGVMDDVPDGAASFGGLTYWLRNVDGVDKADPDAPTDHYFRTLTQLKDY